MAKLGIAKIKQLKDIDGVIYILKEWNTLEKDLQEVN
jgi:hypothetical protein